MTVTLVAAMAENRVIGRDNGLPWHLPADLRRFKRLTSGHPVIMGRKTFDSIGRRPLPNRRNIVVTRDPDLAAPGAETAPSLDEALARLGEDTEVFVLGGAEIFRLALPRADRMVLTIVHAEVAGTVLFPQWNPDHWRLVEEEEHSADAQNAYDLSFRTYERVTGGRER